MIKKIVSLFIAIMGFSGLVSAQTETNTRILNQAAIGFKISADANYEKAIKLAKEKGWALTLSNKNGGKAVLVGVNSHGLPLYRISHNNLIAAATTKVNQLWPGGTSGLNLSGSSANMKNKMGVWDGGAVLGTHVELLGRVTQKDNSTPIDHATHVAGTMIASGVNKLAKGMAYGAQGIIAYDAFTADDIFQMTSEASGLVLSNHSYGYIAGWYQNPDKSNRWEFWGLPKATEDYQFGYYSDYAQALDSVAYNAPFYLMVRSAGNPRSSNGPSIGQPYYRYDSVGNMVPAGNRPGGAAAISSNDSYDILEGSGVAKNVLTVGAVSGIPFGYTGKDDVLMSSFSAWGPTDDGRIKPDIVADGVQVLSSISTSTTSYAAFDGTSMATPNATGSLFLLQEYYSKLKSGAFLRSATLKGLAIHTAEEAGLTPGPDYQYGWGLLNVEKAAAVITAAVPSNNAATSAHLLYENTLAQGQTFSTTVIASGKGILKATICWTDVKGKIDTVNILNNRAKNLVNDLDIRITKGSGASLKTYLPWTLNVSSPANPAVPGDNITDNVERIDIDSTVPGQTYTITISHKGTLVKGPQAYSLLVSGVGGTAYCASTSGGGGARIDSVSFKTIHTTNSAGSKTYTDNTGFITDVEPVSTVPIAVKVSTADATSNSRIVKVFIDVNNNGVFDSNELFATSGTLTSAAQIYNGSVSIPVLTVGNLYLMRIIVQETSVAGDILACGSYAKGETQDFRIRAITGSNDISVADIVSPTNNDCASTAQYLTITINNNGTASQSNIPVTATIAAGSTTVANLSYTYPGIIPAKSSVTYTFQTPFATAGGTVYNITVTANMATDQVPANNTFAKSFTTAAKPAAISAIGGICGTTVNLKVNSPDQSNYLWYSSATGTQPFAIGSTTNSTTIPTDKTYYVAKEVKTGIGPLNKTVLSSGGGYRVSVDGFYVKIGNTVPAVIETARLYIGYPGQIKFTIADLINSTTIRRLSSVTVDVYATTPTPAPGNITGNNSSDTGAIYYLGLSLPTVGDHILLTECINSFGRSDSATIFRNNGITGTTTYPTGISNVINFTGNAQTGSESQFYYNLYDTKINTIGCPSDRTAVIATVSPVPVITQVGDSLVSSIASGNQWYLNDTAITGANLNKYKPKKVGDYKVVVTDAFGCTQISTTFKVTVTATADVLAREINLSVSPNPNNGKFNLSFEVSGKADLSIDILSSSGQKVFNNTYPDFTGKFSKQIQVDNLSSEFYILQIQHNKKTYVKKILVQK